MTEFEYYSKFLINELFRKTTVARIAPNLVLTDTLLLT